MDEQLSELAATIKQLAAEMTTADMVPAELNDRVQQAVAIFKSLDLANYENTSKAENVRTCVTCVHQNAFYKAQHAADTTPGTGYLASASTRVMVDMCAALG